MALNTHFPVFLNLSGRPAVVIGGGRVALRKTRALVRAGAVVTVVAPKFVRGFASLPVGCVDEPYRVSHLRGATVAFAATDDPAVNDAVAQACRAKGILVNVASDPRASDFHVPAAVRRGDIAVAVSTNGASPALASLLRREIADVLANGWAAVAEEAARARKSVLRSTLSPSGRRKVLRLLAPAGLARRLEREGPAAVRKTLRAAVRAAL
ncbi:MAG: bifunctional precorrin-2 dehydrogenase/sirohydrochlorin ferrochelatase [Planctomycetes bacterium]|nr:bifunctional precorrin-2 dehydrogenase/sirohydrochlorin ferrochelatase [Planctomycetota bacterium]